MKQIDRYAKDISEKIDSMFPTISPPTSSTANNYNEMLKNAKDDNYYLERNLQPPRFELYKIARKLMIESNKTKKPVPGIVTSDNIDEYMMVYDTITQDGPKEGGNIKPLVYQNGMYWKLGDNLPRPRQEILDGIKQFAEKYQKSSDSIKTYQRNNL